MHRHEHARAHSHTNQDRLSSSMSHPLSTVIRASSCQSSATNKQTDRQTDRQTDTMDGDDGHDGQTDKSTTARCSVHATDRRVATTTHGITQRAREKDGASAPHASVYQHRLLTSCYRTFAVARHDTGDDHFLRMLLLELLHALHPVLCRLLTDQFDVRVAGSQVQRAHTEGTGNMC
jgi:hypothetical protein